MTPTISTLLLLPAEGDPRGLLAEGPCGARPPVMGFGAKMLDDGTIEPARWRSELFCAISPPGWALVLAHEGKPVTAGCDLLDRAASPDSTHPQQQAHALVAFTLEFGADSAPCRGLHRWLDRNLLGTLIALDPAGRDVTDEVMRG